MLKNAVFEGEIRRRVWQMGGAGRWIERYGEGDGWADESRWWSISERSITPPQPAHHHCQWWLLRLSDNNTITITKLLWSIMIKMMAWLFM